MSAVSPAPEIGHALLNVGLASIQRRRDLVHQIVLGIGLLQDARFAEFLNDVEIDIAGDEDDRQSRSRGVDGAGELNAAPFRHSEVRTAEIYLDVACDQLKPLPSTPDRD